MAFVAKTFTLRLPAYTFFPITILNAQGIDDLTEATRFPSRRINR